MNRTKPNLQQIPLQTPEGARIKTSLSWKPFSNSPVNPKVYEVKSSQGDIHYSRWTGSIWCITSSTKKSAEKQTKQSPSIPGTYYPYGWR